MTYHHNCQSMEIILGIFFLDYVWQNPLISGLWQNPWILHFIASMGFAMELWEMPLHGKTHTPWLLPLCMTFAMHNGFSHWIPYYALDSRWRGGVRPNWNMFHFFYFFILHLLLTQIIWIICLQVLWVGWTQTSKVSESLKLRLWKSLVLH